jgi:hypothetical protein
VIGTECVVCKEHRRARDDDLGSDNDEGQCQCFGCKSLGRTLRSTALDYTGTSFSDRPVHRVLHSGLGNTIVAVSHRGSEHFVTDVVLQFGIIDPLAIDPDASLYRNAGGSDFNHHSTKAGITINKQRGIGRLSNVLSFPLSLLTCCSYVTV